MLRIAILMGCCLSFVAVPAAAQSSAGFIVGVTIGKKVKPPKPKSSDLHYTWGAAAISLSEAGYSHVTRDSEAGGLYWFTARKGEALYRVAVSASTGVIAQVIPA